MDLLTSKEIRLMASSLFHAQRRNGRRPKLESFKTNRKGAWFMKGDMNSGFLIDARCLDLSEQSALATYVAPYIGTEYRDPETGKIVKFCNPARQTSRVFTSRMSWITNNVEIFVLSRDKNTCLAKLFCGITVEGFDVGDTMAQFKAHHATSSHALIEAHALATPTPQGALLAFAA